MPRKGWSTVHVGYNYGWIQLIRGPRPHAGGGDFERPCPGVPIGGCNGSVEESVPSFSEAQGQAQVRPVEDKIVSTKVFIERAKKRVTVCREEVSRAQEVLGRLERDLAEEGWRARRWIRLKKYWTAQPWTPRGPQDSGKWDSGRARNHSSSITAGSHCSGDCSTTNHRRCVGGGFGEEHRRN